MLEAIGLCQEIASKPLAWTYLDEPRSGDHIWYISDAAGSGKTTLIGNIDIPFGRP